MSINEDIIGGSRLEEFIKKDLGEVLSNGSRKGITGLQNLGNTCFMNSGL